MGFSLEAIVAIPCCLTILARFSQLAFPLGTQVNQSARAAAYAACAEQEETTKSCRYIEEEHEGVVIFRVETRPQKMVEALSFVRDLASFAGQETALTGKH